MKKVIDMHTQKFCLIDITSLLHEIDEAKIRVNRYIQLMFVVLEAQVVLVDAGAMAEPVSSKIKNRTI